MRRPVDHRALGLAGFPDRWAVRAGERVAFHLSSAHPLEAARVVRLDAVPAQPCDWPLSALEAPVAHRAFDRGSRLVVAAEDIARLGTVEGVAVEVLLTRNPSRRTLLRAGDWRVLVEGGTLSLALGDRAVLAGLAVPERRWMRLTLGREGARARLTVEAPDALDPFAAQRRFDGIPWPGLDGPLVLGGDGGADEPTANARFARPELLLRDRSVAWPFPTRLPEGDAVASDGPERVVLRAENLPTFCVRSLRWDGSTFDPRGAPDHYDAIHCHETDMGAVDWPPSHAAAVPADAEPGVYALEATAGDATERIPFFVRAAEPRAALLFLVPTATYLAYANEFLPQHLFPWQGSDRAHAFAQGNDLRSLYDFHSDLGGVSITSGRKPMPTLREDYRYPLCGCPHNFPVDLRLLRFCRDRGIPYDILTDHDLHEEGFEALRAYRAVMTGSHPEYLSVEMEEALRRFLGGGGSLLYLGGNGFAATVAFQGDRMELRRGPSEAGRTWDGPLAEQHLAITNEPGGFLRHRGRGEFSLVGGAIALMGFDGARPFRRTPDSRRPDCAWVFDGVEAEVFGETGTVLGAAAGYEVDATDPHLGTHPDTVVLARATGFPPDYVPDPTRWHEGGEAEAQARRAAEMTLRPLPNGGLIFSAGSVAWCGALPSSGETNDVGRITANLIARATRPARAQPEGDRA